MRLQRMPPGAAPPRPSFAPAHAETALLQIVALHRERGTWARIYVDGELVNESHVAYKRLPPGRHQVRLRRDGFHEIMRDVTLEGGEHRKLTLVLERE